MFHVKIITRCGRDKTLEGASCVCVFGAQTFHFSRSLLRLVCLLFFRTQNPQNHTCIRWRDGDRWREKKTDTFRRQSHREINEFRISSSFTSPLKTQINTFLSLARSLAINFHFNHSFLHKQMEFFSIKIFSNSES